MGLFDILIVIIILIAAIVIGICLIKYLVKPTKSPRNYRGGNEPVYIEPVSKENITELKQIEVLPEQQKHVATIIDSLIQASFLKDWHGFAIRDRNSDNAIVGFGSYADYQKIPGGIKIYKMIINKNHQRKGYGRKLLNLLIEDAKRHGRDIYIDVHSDNIPAKNLYLERFDLVSDDGQNALLKLKKL